MISRRLGIVVIAAGTAATLAVIGACNDLSAPRPRPQPAAPIARNWDAPDHPSGFFTPDPLYGGFADSTTLVSHFPEQTAVYIIGAGKIVKHDRAGVLGDASYNAASVTISETFPNGTSQILQFPNNNQQASDTIPFTMQPGTSLIKVSRASWSASNLTITNLYWNGRWINCSPTTTPCYTFDGGHTISVVPIPASYSARSDSQTYAVGSTAKISMTTSPLNMIGSHTPIHVDSALWTAAPDSLGGDAADTIPLNACTNYRWDNQYTPVDWLCDHAVKGSGTLTLIGHANGYRMAPQVPITISGPTLKLTANPSRTHRGDTVTFSPSWSDGFQIAINAWKWKPDSLPNLISQDGGDCTSSETSCTRPIRQDGTMYVTVNRNGKLRTAHARVTVYTTLALVADSVTAHAQSNVRFTPQIDGKTAMAMRWRWAPQDPTVQDTTTCTADTTCVKQMVTTGTMWAYVAASGGDSVPATVTLVTDGACGGTSAARSMRALSLSCTTDPPHVVVTANDSTIVALDTVTFTAEVFSSGLHVTAVGWRWVPKLGNSWDPWTKACSGVDLTCRIQLHGTGDMYFTVVDDENNEIAGTVHVDAAVPEDIGDDAISGDASLPPDWDTGGTSATPVDSLQSLLILATAMTSGNWRYTQACAQCSGGCVTCDYGRTSEPQLDYVNHVGDCTDFVWVAIHNFLGSAWPHQKMNTAMYNSDNTNLAAHGFVQVDSADVRLGDVVVRTKVNGGGHAGFFFGWVAGEGAAGWANNGLPATDTTKNQDKDTGYFMFKRQTGKVVKFFRPQM